MMTPPFCDSLGIPTPLSHPSRPKYSSGPLPLVTDISTARSNECMHHADSDHYPTYLHTTCGWTHGSDLMLMELMGDLMLIYCLCRVQQGALVIHETCWVFSASCMLSVCDTNSMLLGVQERCKHFHFQTHEPAPGCH